jgi:hypothetical protein
MGTRNKPTGRAEVTGQSTDGRLQGTRLLVARAVWVTVFALNLIWFGLAVAAQVATIQHPCGAATCALTPAQAESLRHLGIGLGTFAAYYVGLPALSVVVSLILAALLFWRRSDDWLALVVGLFLVYRVASFAFGPSSTVDSALIVPLDLVDSVIFYGVLLIFPDGRFVPRWAWLLLAAWAAQQLAGIDATLANTTVTAAGNTVTTSGGNLPAWLVTVAVLAYPVLYLSALAIQVYRYRRVSNARQRQQTKWVILGFAVALLANITYWIVVPMVLPIAVPALQHPDSLQIWQYSAIGFPLYQLATIALPVSFYIAIQRYQLFDVDVLINRALVYGSLSILLAAVYFGSIIAMQQIVHAVTGQTQQTNPFVIVVSTLLIAALFNPLRHRIQRTIDRRFYRAKYDAARTLERFAATLRHDIDLAEVREHLVGVVEETMQPSYISLWLRERPDG